MRSIVLSLTMDERLAIYKRVTEVIMSNTEGMPNCMDVRTGHVPGKAEGMPNCADVLFGRPYAGRNN